MRKGLRIFALLLAVGILAFWLASGAKVGWTVTSVAVKKIDPVTTLEYEDWSPVFVPGVDFLFGGLVVASALFGISYLPIKTKSHQ